MKNEIRKLNKQKRAKMAKNEAEEKSRAAAKAFLESEIYKNCRVLMLYMPLGNETDTSYIKSAAFAAGKKVVFPVTNAQTGDITPCYANEQTQFTKGAFSVTEPCGEAFAAVGDIDVVIVPGIAFDCIGRRVGFGKGCYDKFLRKASAIKVGLCYNFQLCKQIPTEEHDVNMDYIVTESGVIDCR